MKYFFSRLYVQVLLACALPACGGGVGSTSAPVLLETLTHTAPPRTVAIDLLADTVTIDAPNNPVTIGVPSDIETIGIQLPSVLTRLPTKDPIDNYEISHNPSHFFQSLGLSKLDVSHAWLVDGVLTGSNTQGFGDGVKTVSLNRHNSNLVVPIPSISLSSSYGWWRDKNGPCRCSIHTRILFYDGVDYEHYSFASDTHAISVSTPAYSKVEYGYDQEPWLRQEDGFRKIPYGTKPTANLRKFGSARYVGRNRGRLSESQDPANHQVVFAAMTMSVAWETLPTIHGQASDFHAYKTLVDGINGAARTEIKKEIASTIFFSGIVWNEVHKAIHNGSIGCLEACAKMLDPYEKWDLNFVNLGFASVDPFMLSGTDGLRNFLFEIDGYDFVPPSPNGLIPKREFPIISDDDESYSYSPERAMMNKLVYNIFNTRLPGQTGHTFTTLAVSARQDVIRSAASITTSYPVNHIDKDNVVGTPLFFIPGITVVHHGKNRSTLLGWMETGFDPVTNNPYITGNAFTTVGPRNGSATYLGMAGGYYTSNSSSGAFVSTIQVGVQFNTTGHVASMKMGYDFGGVTGTLAMIDGQWDYISEKGFSDGTMMCSSGCTSVEGFSSWSAAFFNSKNTLFMDGEPGGLAGKFGAVSIISGAGNDVFDAVGIFSGFLDNSMHLLPPARTYFPARAIDYIDVTSFTSERINRLVTAENRYQRNVLASIIYRSTVEFPTNSYEVVPPELTYVGQRFIDVGGTIRLSTPTWDWRTGDYANCYCTMFLTGGLFESGGRQLPVGLSSSSTLLSRHFGYADARYGWVGGLWTRDQAPGSWHQFGKSQMGIFVDGTTPAELPQSGTVTYMGEVFAVSAWPLDHRVYEREFHLDGHEVLEGEVSVDVTWNLGVPQLVGRMALYEANPFRKLIEIDLVGATWLQSTGRLQSGTIVCTPFCHELERRRDTLGSWESIFIETGRNDQQPGLVAGVFALQHAGLKGYSLYVDSDVFGWMSAQALDDISPQERLLNSPGYSARLAYQQGFISAFSEASAELTNHAVTVDIFPKFVNDRKYNRFGFFSLQPRHEKGRFMYTSFWTAHSLTTTLSLGVDYLASSVAIPTSGSARYLGNAAGIYASSGKEGVFEGDVSLLLQFATDGVEATGKLNLEFSGTTSSFDMSLDDKFIDHVSDGTLVCATGCSGGTLKWGGSLLHTEDTQEPGEIPDGFFGQIKMQGVTMDSTITYDALGMFAAVKE